MHRSNVWRREITHVENSDWIWSIALNNIVYWGWHKTQIVSFHQQDSYCTVGRWLPVSGQRVTVADWKVDIYLGPDLPPAPVIPLLTQHRLSDQKLSVCPPPCPPPPPAPVSAKLFIVIMSNVMRISPSLASPRSASAVYVYVTCCPSWLEMAKAGVTGSCSETIHNVRCCQKFSFLSV